MNEYNVFISLINYINECNFTADKILSNYNFNNYFINDKFKSIKKKRNSMSRLNKSQLFSHNT